MTIDWRAELERQTLQTLGQFQNPAPTIGGVGRTLLQALGSRRPYGEVAAEREAADLNRSSAIVQLLSGQAQMQSAAEEAAYQHEQDAAQMGLQRDQMAQQADQFGQSLGMQQQGLDIQRGQLGVQQADAIARQVDALAQRGHQAAQYLMDLTTQAGIPAPDMSRVIADVTLAAQADGTMSIEELPGFLQATMQKLGITPGAVAREPYTLSPDQIRLDENNQPVAYGMPSTTTEPETWTTLSPADAAGLGFPAGMVLERSSTGQVRSLYEPDAPGDQWTAVPPMEAAMLGLPRDTVAERNARDGQLRILHTPTVAPDQVVRPGDTVLGPNNEPVFTAPADPVEQWTNLTPQELAAGGYAPNTVAQRSSTSGQTRVVQDPDTPLMQSVSPFVAQYEEGQADLASALDAAGTQAQADLDVISQMSTQLEAGLRTGALEPTFVLIQSVAGNLGIDLQGVAASVGVDLNKIGNAQELQRLNAQMVSNKVLDSDAARAFSDGDRRALEGALAGLGRSNEGNQLALAAMRAAAERKAEQARRWHEVRNSVTDPNLLDNAWYDFQAEWEDWTRTNPIQADIDRLLAASPAPTGGQPGSGSSGLSIGEAATIAPTTGGLPTVANQAAFDALRSGAHFLDPNGVERVKP